MAIVTVDKHESRAPEIELIDVGKIYSGTSVLREVSFTIKPGEIHGLLGENGAGKSTLLKILGGATGNSEGQLTFDGNPVQFSSPRDSIAHGVSLIAQELALAPERSVLENVFMGRWSNVGGIVRAAEDRRQFRELCESTGFDLDPDDLVGGLSVGKAQQVEILKALARGSKVVCLDEPTAALNEAESEKLIEVLKELAARGTTIVFVSHFLEEVLALADRITVLRDGNQIITDDAAPHSPDDLIRLMVGRNVDALAQAPEPISADAPVVIDIANLTNEKIKDVSLQVRAGEIVGLVGLVGSGRSELLNAVFGADRVASGDITIAGKSLTKNSVKAAIRRGIALVPESRKEQGLALARSAFENIALPSLSKRQRLGFVSKKFERMRVSQVANLVDIRGEVHSVPIEALSGGNQQKALFAKWLMEPPKVFLIDEPTRGVDIAAKVNIHKLILELAEKGTAVIVASSDLEEVMSISHRLAVMKRGQIVAEFPQGATSDEVMSAAFM